MNDAWYGALSAVRDRTPPESVVFSWWSPGHFVTGVARRHVAVDGGSQAMRENYWICKALMETDENTAAGIFRMLAAGGNRAADLFEKQGWNMARAQKLILRAVRVSREEARKLLPEEWPEGLKEELLDATHGPANPRPSYLMIYDELLVDNVILQMNANWDFEKAEAVYRKRSANNSLANMFGQEQTDYVRRLIEISGQPNVYQVGLNLNNVLGSQMIFENGLVINTATKEAYHMVPAPGKPGMNLEPLDLYLQDDRGQWQMIPHPKGGANAKIVAIYYKQGQAIKGAIVQKDLLETLLFKLFFFEGQDLNRFKLFTTSYDPKSKNTVQIFQIVY
jgi:hypothetical protein